MKIAIHQPNYLPWLGFFYKIFLADIFVFHDAVRYSKSSYTQRTLIRKDNHGTDVQWLGFSIRNSTQPLIRDKLFVNRKRDLKRHHRKFYYLYAGRPYFEEFNSFFSEYLVNAGHNKLAESNIQMILAICELLGIQRRFVRSSDLKLAGSREELNIGICKTLGATTYLSGVGAKKYQSSHSFIRAGIDLRYVDVHVLFRRELRPIGMENHLPGLSIVDAWVNIGLAGILKLFSS